MKNWLRTVLDEVAEVPRGVAHQRPGGLGLHAVELVVHRRDGDRDLPRRPLRLIRGMDTPKGFEDHHTHQLERRREQQLPRILLLGDGLEPVVEAGGLEDAFEQRSQHHRDRKRLAGSAEKRIQYHGTSNRAIERGALPDESGDRRCKCPAVSGIGTAHHARRGGPSKRQASKPTVPFSGSRRSLAND